MADEKIPLLPQEELPIHLRSKGAKVFSLIIVFICCAIASGPLTAFPSLVKLLVEANVDEGPHQQSDLSTVYSISMGVTIGTFFITGIVFDRLGAQKTATIGSIFVAVGFVLSWASVNYSNLNALLYFAFPWTYFWGIFNSFGVYGFLPLFPESQTLVVGLANSSFLISSAMAYAFIGMTNIGISFEKSLLIFAGLCIIVAVVVYLLTPSQSVCLSLIPKEYVKEPTPIKQLVAVIWGEFNRNRTANIIFLLWSTFLFPFLVFFIGEFYPYYKELLGDKNADFMSTIFPIFYAVFGAIGSPFLGALLDKIGFKNFLILCQLSLIGFAGTVFIPNINVQYVSMFLLSMQYSCVMLAAPQWALLYVPPDLFGSFFGFIFLIVGVAQIGMTILIPSITKLYATGVYFYVIPFSVLMILTLISGFVLIIYLIRKPPPTINGNSQHNNQIN